MSDQPGLSNMDYADFDLLQVISREDKGTTEDLALTLNRPKRATASRLAWMLRMKLVERTIADNWILSPKGREVVDGKSGDIMALRDIASRSKRSAPLSWVMRREARRDLG